MKKTFLLKNIGVALILTFSFFQVSAQFSKGTWLVETSFGNIALGNSKYEYLLRDTMTSKSEGHYFSADLYPRLGYFINDKIAVGTEFEIYFYSNSYYGYNQDGTKYYESKSGNTSLGFMPFVRYYFYSSSNGKSMYYGQLSAGTYLELSETGDSKYFDAAGNVTGTYKTEYVHNYKSFSGSIMAGWNHFISQNVALNFNLGYTVSKSSSSYNDISTWGGVSTTDGVYKSKYTSGNLAWNMGLTMFIPGKNSGN